MANVQARVDKLAEEFEKCLNAFERRRPFRGPSLHLHLATIRLRRGFPNAEAALWDDTFLAMVYGTLASWGMHRAGTQGPKLVDLGVMADSLRWHATDIGDLEPHRLSALTDEAESREVGRRLCDLMADLRVSATESWLVASSKALHHVLPDLVPPIDRQYTLRFFYGYKPNISGDQGAAAFRRIFPHLRELAVRCAGKGSRRRFAQMHTSETKVIDNAIVGYVRRYMKKA